VTAGLPERLGALVRPRGRREGRPAGPGQVIDHTNLYWRYQKAPGRTAGVVKSAEVEF
jgi:hypothetical protein